MYNTYRKQGGIVVAKVGNRQNKTLECTVCGQENYRTNKNVKTPSLNFPFSQHKSGTQV